MPHGYRPFYSLENVSAIATGAVADIGASTEDVYLQIVITGTATVQVEASQNNRDWQNVSDPAAGYTASTLLLLDHRAAFYRTRVTAYTSGTITAIVGYGRGRFNQLLNMASSKTPEGFNIGHIDFSLVAPVGASYLVGTPDSILTAERVVTDTPSVTWDLATAGQAKAKRAALTGDVTAAADANATTIANDAVTTAKIINDAVTYAKMQNVSAASKLLGRGDSGAGDPQEITLGANLTMTGTTLAATGGGGVDGHIIQHSGDLTQQPYLTFLAPLTGVNVGAPGAGRTEISLVANPTNDGGTIAKQATSPGTAQTGNAEVTGVFKANTRIRTDGLLTTTSAALTLVNGDNHDVDVGTITFRIITGPSAGFAITGFVAAAGVPISGDILTIYNPTAQAMTIKNQNAGSTAQDRIITLTGADVALGGPSFASFIYDFGAARWIMSSSAPAPAGGGGGAPTGAEYLVGATDATLTAERLVTDTASVTWDLATGGQAKAKRAALTGDVTASADSNATTIANDAVTMAKLADLAASTLIGRRSGSTGDPEAVTLGSGLSMSAGGVLSSSGGGGITEQDIINIAWGKKFFADGAVLPATERVAASLFTVPTETGVASGTFTKLNGHATFSGSASVAYWDLGALRSDVLVAAGGILLLGAGIGIILTATAPAGSDTDGYLFNYETDLKIYKRAAGTYTALVTLANPFPDDIRGMAFYYNDSAGTLTGFVRLAGGNWMQMLTVSDSTYTTMRYVGLRMNTGSRLILPFTAWSE